MILFQSIFKKILIGLDKTESAENVTDMVVIKEMLSEETTVAIMSKKKKETVIGKDMVTTEETEIENMNDITKEIQEEAEKIQRTIMEEELSMEETNLDTTGGDQKVTTVIKITTTKGNMVHKDIVEATPEVRDLDQTRSSNRDNHHSKRRAKAARKRIHLIKKTAFLMKKKEEKMSCFLNFEKKDLRMKLDHLSAQLTKQL